MTQPCQPVQYILRSTAYFSNVFHRHISFISVETTAQHLRKKWQKKSVCITVACMSNDVGQTLLGPVNL